MGAMPKGMKMETSDSRDPRMAAEGHLRNALESLAAAMDEARLALQALSSPRAGGHGGRQLRPHPAARKRMVSQFLSWCWRAGGVGACPETEVEEFRLYGVWAKRACPAADRAMAAEIDTLREYSACREGLRKMWPDKWKALQAARKSLMGNGAEERPRLPPRG